jgi:hypothetical protein
MGFPGSAPVLNSPSASLLRSDPEGFLPDRIYALSLETVGTFLIPLLNLITRILPDRQANRKTVSKLFSRGERELQGVLHPMPEGHGLSTPCTPIFVTLPGDEAFQFLTVEDLIELLERSLRPLAG